MTKNLKISLTVVIVVVAVAAVIFLATRPDTRTPAGASGGGQAAATLVRADSHRLSAPQNQKVTVVEFLDLECEACRAAFPGVERLREEYGDRVGFVLRYFPVPSHPNAELAATAVEAAARQDKLEPMYQQMYRTQLQWGHQQTSQRATFVDYARQLGLDVPRFERDLDDPSTLERVISDRNDGLSLGVQGTPTFFVNGEAMQEPPTYAALKARIEQALASTRGAGG